MFHIYLEKINGFYAFTKIQQEIKTFLVDSEMPIVKKFNHKCQESFKMCYHSPIMDVQEIL